jgi:hypothetical protein
MSLDFPCKAHTFFPERMSNHCHCLGRTFSEICTKFDGCFFVRFVTKSHTLLQIKKHKSPERPPSCDSLGVPVLSSSVASRYYNCRTDGRTSPGNYGYSLVCVCVCVYIHIYIILSMFLISHQAPTTLSLSSWKCVEFEVLRRVTTTRHFYCRVGCDWVHLLRRPLFGLLYQSRMMDDDEFAAVGGWYENWQGKSKYSEETCHFVHHKSHITRPGPPRQEASNSPPELRHCLKVT